MPTGYLEFTSLNVFVMAGDLSQNHYRPVWFRVSYAGA